MTRVSISADELDDAAYRARWAPLAAAVLPQVHAAVPVAGGGQPDRVGARWRPIMLAVLAGAMALVCGTWTYW
jgi:phosphate/sulfate permease